MRNYVQLIGHVGADPEIRQTSTGKQTARFSVATSNYYKTADGERVQSTTWHRIIGWNKTAELMSSKLNKGSRVMIEGRIENREFEDKEGNTRHFTEIIARSFLAL